MAVRISVDAMGGDKGLGSTIPAVVKFLGDHPDAKIYLVGLEPEILEALSTNGTVPNERLKVVAATQTVTMDDPVEVALRKKKDSSMRLAVNLLKSGEADACVSGGNTGALMAISRYVLGTLPGVSRPAICMYIPNRKGGATYMLDLGANVDCEPSHLRQFALMAHVLLTSSGEKRTASIGLLNIGTEDLKGNLLVKNTAALLRLDHSAGKINFYGNVEGKDIFEGTVDIVVCDGFVGNVALKVIEGLAVFFVSTLKEELTKGLRNLTGAFLAKNGLRAFSRKLKPSRYNGGNLLGLRGLVFKSHGSADEEAFYWAIKRAYDSVHANALQKLAIQLQSEYDDAVIPVIGSLELSENQSPERTQS